MPPPRWPFLYQPRDAMITLKRIVFDGAPILMVTHDTDGGYQFLDAQNCTEEEAAIVALEEILSLDPTLAEIACLPPGFCAGRKSPEDPWAVWEHEIEE